MSVPDDRGLGKQLKRILPPGLFRLLTVVFNSATRFVPFHLKYAVVGRYRRRSAPYRFLNPTDTVVQVGSARDILCTGRSRSIHFSRMVPEGRVIVVEADASNCEALRRVIRRHGITNIEVVECGAWEKKTTLAFLSSPHHPASNLLADAKDVPQSLVEERRYQQHLIEVNTIDDILRDFGADIPAMISITTNGAELKILQGMQQTIAGGCPYITLASTGEGFHENMAQLGYQYVARDDRGYCFRKQGEVPPVVGSGARAA